MKEKKRHITDGRTWTLVSQEVLGRIYEKGWEDAIFGEAPVPPTAEIRRLDEDASTKYESDLREFNRANNSAKGLLYQHMDSSDYRLYGALTAKQIWSALEAKYKEVHLSLFAENYDKLLSIRILDSDDLDTVMSKAYKISTAIDGLNRLDHAAGRSQPAIGTFGYAFKVAAILRVLPNSFATLKQTWNEKLVDPNTYTFECLLASLRAAHEDRSDVVKSSKGSKHFMAATKGKESTSEIPSGDFDCYTCRVKHHRDYQCDGWKKRQAKINRDKEFEQMKALFTKLQAETGAGGSGLNRDTENDDLFQCSSPPLALVTMSDDVTSEFVTLDSACHPSFFREKRFFRNLKTLSEPRRLTVAFGLSAGTKDELVLGQGDLVLPHDDGELVLRGQYFAPGLSYNLLSEGVLDTCGYRVLRECGKASVIERSSNTVLLSFDKVDGLYVRSISPPAVQPVSTSSTQGSKRPRKKATLAETRRFHERYGHPAMSTMQRWSQTCATLPVFDATFDTIGCEGCQIGKSRRASVQRSARTEKRTTELLELIHTDICGPFPKSLGGSCYFATFTDDFSRYTRVHLLPKKSDMIEAFRVFQRNAERRLNKTIKMVRSDNGGEYTASNFEKLVSQLGIDQEFTPVDRPEKNGVAERVNRTLQEKTLCMLAHAKLPRYFWAEALREAAAVMNATPRVGQDRSPHELFWSEPPKLNKTRVFGCVMWAVNLDRKKLDDTARKCVNLGYVDKMGRYKLWDPLTRRITGSADVVADETKFLSLPGYETVFSMDQGVRVPSTRPELPSFTRDTVPILAPTEADPLARQGNYSALRAMATTVDSADVNDLTEESSFVKTDPETDLQDDVWRLPKLAELENMTNNKVWDVVDRPVGVRAIGCRWVLTTKPSTCDTPVRYKARLVAQGFSQREGLDYEETFAPVARTTTSRLLFAYAASRGLTAHQLDYVAAFLNGELEETIYMKIPDGMDTDGSLRGKVLRLNRAIYGLKQAGRVWNQSLDSKLKQIGWTPAMADECLYRHQNGSLLCVHVDDILLVPTMDVDKLKGDLCGIFKAKDLGIASNYLGMKVEQTSQGISLTSSTFVRKLLDSFSASFKSRDCESSFNARKTPMDIDDIVSKDDSPVVGSAEHNAMKSKPFRAFVGSVSWLSLTTRPDIAFTVLQLAKVQSNPAFKHWEICKKLYRYLLGTVDAGLFYRKGLCRVAGFCDSSWGEGTDERRSTTGWVFMVNDTAISWGSRLQKTVSTSSTEAEYMAITEATKETLWLRQLMREVDGANLLEAEGPDSDAMTVTIYVDNKGAIQIAKNPTSHSRTKHIEVRHFFVRQHVKEKRVKMEYVESKKQAADCLTKPLSFELHRAGALRMGMFFGKTVRP